MLAFGKRDGGRERPRKCTPNVLPCRINHNGPVCASRRYWAPREGKDGKRTSYFRGRKLRGRVMKVPAGYEGVVVAGTEKVLEREVTRGGKDGEEEEEEEDVGILDKKGVFEEVVVWGHEVEPEEGVDAYLLGLEEWIAMAEKVHAFEAEASESDANGKNDS